MGIVAISWAGVRAADFWTVIESCIENQHSRLHACPLIAFEATDLAQARGEVDAMGVKFGTDIDSWKDRARRCFRRSGSHFYAQGRKGSSHAG